MERDVRLSDLEESLAGEVLTGLMEQSTFVQAVLDTVDVGIVACDAEGSLTVVNSAARAAYGLPAAGRVAPDHVVVHCADGTTLLAADRMPLVRALAEGRVSDVELVVTPPGAEPRRVRCDGRAVHDDAGQLLGAVLAVTDLTVATSLERRLREAQATAERLAESLARSEELVRTAFEHSPVAMCWVDRKGVVVQANPALRRLVPLADGDLTGTALSALVVPPDRERLELAVRAAGVGAGVADPVEVRLRRPGGQQVWCELTSTSIARDSPTPSVLIQLSEVDSRWRRESRLAAADPLTGLANRSALVATLAERLEPGEGPPELALLFVDLDEFKAVNDTLGHAAGDLVLIDVGRRLQAAVRPGDLVARLHDDAYVVVGQDLSAGEDGGSPGDHAEVLADRLRRALEPPVELPSGALVVRATIRVGRALPGEHPAVVLARGDSAVHAHKARRRGSSLMRGHAAEAGQPRLADLVVTAVREDRLSLVYQPVVDLRTGATIGVEALARMVDREGRRVMPDAFIPVAESGGAIHEIGDWVLQTACAQAVRWKRLLPAGTDFVMGLNLSPRQLDDAQLLDRLDVALLSSGLPPSALALELTERLLTAANPRTRAVLSAIRDRDVHLAADDFGTGYASVSYLCDLPFDIIKIDRSWTSRLTGTGAASRLASGVARLAEATGLTVVAEGVETEQERAAVLAHGCTMAQGYLFARPLPVEELTDRLLLEAVR